jgi:Uncharacterized protein conserved in archaea
MKNKLPLVTLLLVTLTFCFILNVRLNAKSLEGSRTKIANLKGSIFTGAKAAKADEELTLSDMLTYAIQDEYLAKSRNQLVISKFGQEKPFPNILKSEMAHIASLKPLFAKYNVPIPPDDSLQYVKAPDNLRGSFEAGMQGEIESMEMYERFLKENIPEDVKSVFIQLKKGALNHLV